MDSLVDSRRHVLPLSSQFVSHFFRHSLLSCARPSLLALLPAFFMASTLRSLRLAPRCRLHASPSRIGRAAFARCNSSVAQDPMTGELARLPDIEVRKSTGTHPCILQTRRRVALAVGDHKNLRPQNASPALQPHLRSHFRTCPYMNLERVCGSNIPSQDGPHADRPMAHPRGLGRA